MSILSFAKKIVPKKAEAKKSVVKKPKAAVKAESMPAKETVMFSAVSFASRIAMRPWLTEKGVKMQSQANTYAFRVLPQATKGQIASAVFELYKVKPAKVRTLKVRPKSRTRGRTSGWTNAWKKAYVTLPAGKTIDFTV